MSGVDSGAGGVPASGLTMVPSTGGVQIAVHDFGGPAAPEAVLLFSHATGFHGLVWAPMAAQLVDRYRCLALDYRGHGASTLPAGTSLVWTHMGDDAVAVLDAALSPPEVALHGIAHSMGGAALVLAAARRPHAFRSLWLYEPVIVEPGYLPPPGAPNPMADGAARRRARFDSYEEAIANYAAKPPLDRLNPEALAAYVRGGFRPADDGGDGVVLRCAPSTEAAVFRGAGGAEVWSAVSALTLPVAMAAGRDDEYGPVAFVDAAVARLADGTLRAHRGLGHFGPLEDPAAMARDVAEWVAAHP